MRGDYSAWVWHWVPGSVSSASWISTSSLWWWGSATSLCCSNPSILVTGTKAELSAELRREWNMSQGAQCFPSSSKCLQLGDICAGFILQIFEVCGSNWSLFPWENQRERAPFPSECLHPPSTAKQVLPLGSCQISSVGLEPLASQEKVVKLPDEWNRPISWVSDTKQRQRNVRHLSPLIQPWQGCWHCQKCPALGVAAGSLPSLQSTELLLSFLVNFFTFSFHNLKIARMKASFSKLFSPFFPFYNHLSDSCLIF